MNERVLVVDDESSLLDLASSMLIKSGLQVVVADSGEMACNKINLENFDLICTDVNMPGMDGFTLVSRSKEKDPDIPVLVMTGLESIKVSTEMVANGIDGFIQKPFSPDSFMGAVYSALGKRRLKKENTKLKSIYPLFEVNHMLMHHQDMTNLLEVIIGIVQKESGADSVSIALKNDDSSFSIVAAVGLEESYCKGYRLRDDGIAVRVAKSGEPLVLDNDRESTFQYGMVREELSSAMIIPLKVKNNVIGVLSVTNKKGHIGCFSKSDLDFMAIIAGQASMSLRNEKLFEELEEFFFGSIRSFTSAIDAKSPWTAGHSERVTSYACILGYHMGLSVSELEELEVAAILHDIGKIGVSETILEKANRLTKVEFDTIKGHPDRGAKILAHVKPLKKLIPYVRAHHEHFDGSGYPDGLSGKDIPLIARILKVADSYDAMKSDRPYRSGQSHRYIVDEFIRCSGTQFDPDVVGPFLDILCEDKLHGDLLLKVPEIRKFYGPQLN